jgi:SAM-dependent methyltransferase
MVSRPIRVLKAVMTNQLARVAPAAYVRITGQTGRGDSKTESPASIAEYFRRCFDDYVGRLNISDPLGYFEGKKLVEYGPGDVPGVALLMAAYGAQSVVCVDRFPLLKLSPLNRRVLEILVSSLTGSVKVRGEMCLKDLIAPSGISEGGPIQYVVSPSGLSHLRSAADLIYSRAVLEHVNDLRATLRDMWEALRPQGVMIHLVDLKSHGLHDKNPLDFLAWPPFLWELMYSEKGVPNRWRVNQYRTIFSELGIESACLESVASADMSDVKAVRPSLPEHFQSLSDEDLACLGFWFVARKKS